MKFLIVTFIEAMLLLLLSLCSLDRIMATKTEIRTTMTMTTTYDAVDHNFHNANDNLLLSSFQKQQHTTPVSSAANSNMQMTSHRQLYHDHGIHRIVIENSNGTDSIGTDDNENETVVVGNDDEEGAVLTQREGNEEGEQVQADDVSIIHSTTTSAQQGSHKSLLPLDSTDYIGLGLTILGLLIASAGAIGGGAILVPIYLLIMKFPTKYAISLSMITVLGSSIANVLYFVYQRHPVHNKPLIDYDLILMMEPFAMLGAVFGVLLNKMIPELILTILLIILLTYTCYETLKKAISMYQKETIAIQNSRNGSNTGGTTAAIFSGSKQDNNYQSIPTSDSSYSDDDNQKLQSIIDSERNIPIRTVVLLFGTVSIVLLINILKGGSNTSFPSIIGIQCGSVIFWLMNLLVLLIVLIVAFYYRSYLLYKHQQKMYYHYPYASGDIQWDTTNTTYYPLLCTAAGFFAGMFGIGGGMVKGPLMLAMGVLPTVSAASVSVMIFCTSFTATTSNIVFGLVLPDYGIALFFVGFISTLIGQMCLSYIMKKSQRNSYIAFSIGFVVLISTILLSFQSILFVVTKLSNHEGSTLFANPGGVCA